MTTIRHTLAAFALLATLATGVSPAFAHHPESLCRIDQSGEVVCDEFGVQDDDLFDLIDYQTSDLGPTIPHPDAL